MSFRRCQSRSASLIEAIANVVAGFLIAVLAQQIVFPVFGILTTFIEDAGIAATFTALSLVRGYLLRRVFERLGTGRGPNNRRQPGRLVGNA